MPKRHAAVDSTDEVAFRKEEHLDQVSHPQGRQHGATGNRIDPRVEFPLEIEFQNGERWTAQDWSLGGFSLGGGQLASAVGNTYAVRLITAILDSEMLVKVNARVVRAQDGYALGFQFIDLSASQIHILNRLIQTGLDGEASFLDPLVNTYQKAAAHPQHGNVREMMRSTVDAGKSLLICGLIIACGILILSHLLTVTADYAAVSAGLRQISAPEAGFLVSDVLSVGTHVKEGQTIAMVQPVATPQARLSTETQIITLEVSLSQQIDALAQTRDGFSLFLQTSRTNYEESTAARKLLDQQVAAEEKNFERLLMMQGKKIVADSRVDQERQVLLGLQRVLSTARDTESMARNRLSNAEAGLFPSDGRSTQKSPADIERAIATTRASIDRLREIFAAFDKPMPIYSPCDCRVASVFATPGVYVLAGASLADLALEHRENVLVDALIQHPRLTYIHQGQSVAVYFANSPESVDGRVSSINYNPANNGRTGLPNSLRTLADYGLMTVEVDRPATDMVSGIPVTIVAPIEWRTLLANAPFLVWCRNVADNLLRSADRIYAAL